MEILNSEDAAVVATVASSCKTRPVIMVRLALEFLLLADSFGLPSAFVSVEVEVTETTTRTRITLVVGRSWVISVRASRVLEHITAAMHINIP